MINNRSKRVALLMAVLMLVQMLPVQALADTIYSDAFTLGGYMAPMRGGESVYHTVHFKDHDDTHLGTAENVLDGTTLAAAQAAAGVSTPTREGYTFVQWTPPETYITGDTATEFTFTAQYRSTDLYELRIDYKYENGSPAALSYLATLAYGEDYEVTSPTIQGFYVDPAANEIISGEAGTSQNGALELNYTVTYKASTGTRYTVEHYQQNIDDDEYTKIGTETEVFYATTGSTVTVNSKDFTGFTAKTPTQEATIAPDGSTVVKMYYDRIYYILTFDTAGGTFIPPFQGRYGASVPAVDDPTRTGYTFDSWSTPIPDTLTQSQTITAQWIALSNVNYTLVYWLENADPIPGTTTYGYSYRNAVTRTGTAGAVYTISAADKPTITYFTYNHYDENQTIAGDGSTVINIYYTRNSYTATFILNRNNATMTIGGVTYYNYGPNYSFTAKYNSNISHLWPTSDHIPPVGSSQFYTWRPNTGGSNWTSKQTVFIPDLLNRTFTAQWSATVIPYDLHYMFESLDGTGTEYGGRYYQQDSELSQRVYSVWNVNWTAKDIPGMTNFNVIRHYRAAEIRYDVYFYYTRNTYTLDFQNHGQVVPGKSRSLMYGASILQSYNFTPDTPSDLQGYSFGGWYSTPECTPGTEFVWAGATMPAHDLRLFAKWVPPIYNVRFKYTQPDGTPVSYAAAAQQVTQGQKAVRPDDPPAIPGYDFDGWYYEGTMTKYSFDAQVFSSLDLTGRYLPKNDRTYTVRYLFAVGGAQAATPKTVTGQTMGATVAEQAVEVSGYLPDALSKTLTLAADNNVITFYYSAPNVDYTVRYLDRDTGIALLDSVTKNSQGQTAVTETAPSITNKPYQLPDNSWVIVDFNPDMPEKSLTLTSDPDLNIITFYYKYVIKHHYEVHYLEIGTDVELAQLKHVITAKSEVVELPKAITNYRPHSVVSTYPNLVRGSSANYISTKLGVVDPVSQDAQVITFYYAPEHVDITGTKTWVDQGIEAPDQRPDSLSITLYANNVELSPQPVPTWTSEGDTWTYTYINLPAAAEGVPKYYTVRETVPGNYAASYSDKGNYGGTNITNTLEGSITTFSGTKVWVDSIDQVSGYNPRPATLVLTFYRKGHNNANWVKMSPQPAYSWEKPAGSDTWTYTATGLKKYEDGYLVDYKAEETLPLGYEKTIDDGQHFKNEVIYTYASKTWVNGPAEHPTIWLQVHRQVGENGIAEPCPLASLKKLENGTTQVYWRGLEQTDANGNPYIFSVREVNAAGELWTPPNYTKTENGLNVTNTYVIPTTGKATGTKTWVNGAATHPDLWLRLYRKTTTGSPLVDEAVPGAAIVKVNAAGDTSHEWTGLETTDINGNAYTFYIKEGKWENNTFTAGAPENYELTAGEGTLNLTNTYVIPTEGEFTATKVWVDGSQVAKPAVWFQLQRRVANGTWAPVTDAGVLPLQVTADNFYTVTWNSLEETDLAARPYEFRVVEGVYNEQENEFTPGSPSPFEQLTDGAFNTENNAYEITNTYVSPKRDDIIVSKDFATTCTGGSAAPVTPVTLELRRKVGNADAEKVGNSVTLDGDIDEVEFNPWQARFTDLDATDKHGNTYTYWVKEPVVPGNYVDTYNQNTFTVTNTWQGIPFTAKKEWAGGYTNMPRPPVSFQLQRKTANMEAPENVGSPVVLIGEAEGIPGKGSGEHTAWAYTWESLPKNNSNNKPYTYTFTETRVPGYNPSQVTLDADGLGGSITNTFEGVSVSAAKRIVIPKRYSSATVNPPPFTLTLYRNGTAVNSVILNGVADTQGGAGDDALKPDGSGEMAPSDVETDSAGNTIYQWHYTWNNLPKNDEHGDAYTYTVGEPNVPLNYVRVSVSEESGVFVITNEYNDGTFRAKKEWNTKTGTPSVTFRLQRAKITDPNPDNWTWTDLDLDIDLNGIADSTEGNPNGTVRYEDIPWRAVWTGLPAQVDGVLVKYRVQEDSIANYEVDTATSASTVITNTSLKANITARKVWVGGETETVRPASITLSLSRYYEGGTTEDTGYQPPAAATLTKPEDNNNDWGTHTWENQERFYTDQGVQKEYVYKVTESYALTADKGSFTANCEVVDGVLHTITNTYTPPTRNYYMKKAWDGGKPRPVTVQLQRKYAGEDDNVYTPMGPGHTLDGVADEDYGEFSNAMELENWVLHRPDLVWADNTGRAYQYRIIELSDLSAYGFSYDVQYNTKDATNPADPRVYDAVVINTYTIPNDGEATVKKVWVNGAAQKPDIYFQLWRKTTTGTDDVREKVPGLGPIKINDYANDEFTFTGLDKTDFYANPYTFFVVEGSYEGDTFTAGNPLHYELTTTGDSLTLTNSYVIPTTGTATATKTWVNGPAAKPKVWFQLHRKTSTGSWEAVPGAEIKQVPAELSVSWSGLETTDINGNAYEFGVVEGSYKNDTFTAGAPENYTATAQPSLEITNTYVPPKREDIMVSKAFKISCDGIIVDDEDIAVPVTPVTLELRRKSSVEEDYQKVGESVTLDGNIDAVEFFPWQAKFTNLDATDKDGNSYTYEVWEQDVPGNYVESYNQDTFTVINTWQTTSYTVNKVWADGYEGMEYPSVQLQLWRQSEGMTEREKVPTVGLVTLPAITENLAAYTWENLPLKDANNKPYEYTVSEVTGLVGYTTTGPAKINGVDTITNTYNPVQVSATKVFKAPGGAADLPELPEYVELQLSRHIEGSQEKEVVETVQLNGEADTPGPDGSGEGTPDEDHEGFPQWHYTWKNLPEKDAEGNSYNYEVHEPLPPIGGWVREMETEGPDRHWTIINVHQGDVFMALKRWDTKADTSSVTFQLWQQQVDSENDPIDGTEVYMEGRDLVLSGTPGEGDQDHEGDVTAGETGPIWSAVWAGNLPIQAENGNTVKYYIVEEEALPVAQGGNADFHELYDTVTHASTIIENISRTTVISAKKIWVNGDTLPRPETTLTLKRYKEGNVEDTSFALEGTVGGTTTTYTWPAQERFYEEGSAQKAWIYDVEETEPQDYAQTQKEVNANGTFFTFTNTYVPPTVTLKAAKVWDGGDASNRSPVTFHLWRRISGSNDEWALARANTPGHTLDGIIDEGPHPQSGAEEYAPWKMRREDIPLRDINGNLYEYKITETATVPGFEEPNYLTYQEAVNEGLIEAGQDDPVNFVVVNTYIIPTDGTATGTKIWVNGAAEHPELWLQLWRKIDIDNPLVDVNEAVPGADVIKAESTGDTTHTWTGLETTDINGNVYTFYIKEGQWDGTDFTEGVPANYTRTGTGTLNLTNTYVIPTNGTFEATKVWKDGTEVVKPEVWFQLQRRVANGTWAAVPGADIKQVPTTAPFTVPWNNLVETDSAARPYEFKVVEGRYNEGTQVFTPGSPSPFEQLTAGVFDTENNAYEITNTYVSPIIDPITVGKNWSFPQGVDGDLHKTEVTLSLMRSLEGSNAPAEPVQDIELDGIIGGDEQQQPWRSTIEGLPERNQDGVKYNYSVVENDVPANFVATVEGYIVTNAWQTTSFTAKKKWSAPAYVGQQYPAITFQLQRSTDGLAFESVGDPVTISSEPWTYTWTNLPKYSPTKELYTYTFTETRVAGYTPSGPVVENDIPTITNTFEGVSVKATKRIVIPARYGTAVIPPSFSLTLYRNDVAIDSVTLNGVADTPRPDGSGETAPDLVGTDGNGNTIHQWHYTWMNLPKYDENGAAYAYTVGEPAVPPLYVRTDETVDATAGFVITNEYNDGTFRAHKEWDTKTGTPSVTFRLQRAKITDPNPDNWTWTDLDLDIDLNGIADSTEGNPNGTVRYEDIPWRAVWTGLPAQVDGVLVKYRVQEDSIANYEVDTATSASTVITNTSLKTNITAKKVWVGGETVRPEEITLTLTRYYSDGETPDTDHAQPAPATLTPPEGGGDDWGMYTWKNQPRFYDDNNVRKEYVYKATASITLGENEGSFISECEVAADGVLHTITSTYNQPFVNLKAAKVWDGGDASNRPAVTIRLWRKYASEGDDKWAHANPSAPGHTLDGVPETENHLLTRAKEYAPWKMEGMAPLRDKQGNLFEYKITETATVPGFKDPVYTYNDTLGYVVTNKYIIPTTGTATAKKVFDLGENAAKPDVWFQLWRKTDTGTREKVPGLDPIKINDYAGYEYTFTGLEQTDFDANPYTFFVVEGSYDDTDFTPGDPLNYELTTIGDSLTLTNRYVIPTTGTATATKTWVNGPDTKPDVWFQLHRKTAGGNWSAVPGAAIQKVPDFNPDTPDAALTVSWSGLEATDENGNAYAFAVEEGIYDEANDAFTPGAPLHYTAEGRMSLGITNTYDPPADAAFTATKTWAGGPGVNKTAVTLALYRESDNVTTELVTGVTPQITGEAPTYTYQWNNLISRDSKGELYTFTVQEPGVDTEGYVTINGSVYKVSYDADHKDVTNTYQIPKEDVTATKKWIDGPIDSRPDVWFKLQRRILGVSSWADVPGADIKQVPAQELQNPNAALSVTWADQERTNFAGLSWEYAVVEGKLENDVFTEAVPENYALSGQGTLDLTNTYTIPTKTLIAQKQWVNGPTQKPTVWFKLQRALPNGQPADIPAGQAGSLIRKLLPGVLSVQWDNVEQTDIAGKPYTFSIVEGLLNEDTQVFTPGLPDSYEYTVTAMTGSLGVVNTYTSPTGSKTTRKIWAGGGPTPYPDNIWLCLERTTSPILPFERVPNAVPAKVTTPTGSTESNPITWEDVVLKDDNGVPYVFRVLEGVYDGVTNTFTPGAPANYVSDSGQYDMGQGLQNITNTWQTFDLSVEIVWDGAPAAAYDLPDDRTATLSLYRYTGEDPTQKEKLGTVLLDGITYKITTDLKYVGRATAEGWKVKVSALPKYSLDTGELYTYLVEQSDVLPVIYTANPPVQTGGDWVFTNTFDKTTVEVFKKYEQTTERPPVTIVLFQNGAEFDRFELDGIPYGSADSGEPYEANPGLLIWPNLPVRTLPNGENPSVPAVYTVTEELPANYPYQRVITGNATDGFRITNTKNDGSFTAVKRWNIGQAPLPESVTFKLWRWVSGSGYHEKEAMPEEYDGVMDGTVDTAPGAHGMESKPWEYTWTNLPLNGNYNNDPTQPVHYTYFVEEVPLGSDYIVDAVTSSSIIIKNIALKTQFTARKIWGGGPEPPVHFQLMRTHGTESVPIGAPVELDGVVDTVPAGQSGELSPWAYTWTDLPRFVDDDPATPYTYTAIEVDAEGNDFTPAGYARYNNNSSRIINIHNSDVSAVKTWVGGDAQRAEGIGPDTYFTLHRRTIFEEEAVALAPDHEDLNGQPVTKPVALWDSDDSPNTVTVTWAKLPWGTDDGLPYIYSVVETDSGGNPKALWQDADAPQTYIYNTTYDENDPLKVTDTYQSPTRGVEANKHWHGVAEGDSLPGVWLKLWRGLTDDNQALVPAEEADTKAIPGAAFTAGQSSQVSWAGVLKFDAQGREYLYTTREYAAAGATEPGAPEGFANARAGLNQHNMKLMDIKATKLWQQLPENAIHPEVVLQLKRAEAGSAAPAQVVDTYTVAAGTDTSVQHIFKNKPIYGMNADEEIVAYIYTVDEAAVPNGYTKQVSGNAEDGFIVTNTYDGVSSDDSDDTNDNPISIKATKAWAYPAGIAEPSDADKSVVRFNLRRNDNELMGEKTPVHDTVNPWRVVWEALYRYDTQGNAYRYEAFEVAVPDGYKASVTGSQEVGYTITNAYDGTGADGKLLDVAVSKEWRNQDGQVVTDAALLPENLSIRLIGGNAPAEAYLLTPDADGNWSHTYRNLYAYDTRGKPITYSVSETAPNGYEQQPTQGDQTDGFVLVNTYDGVTNNKSPAAPGNPQEPVTIHIAKTWQDADGQAITDNGKLPASLLLTLHGGALVADEPLTLTGADKWKASLKNRAKYDSAGEEITYSLTETVPNGYAFSQVHSAEDDVHTFALTNRYDGVTNNEDPATPQEPVTFTATKEWKGLPAGAKGATVPLQLKRNDVDYGDAVLVADDGAHAAEHTWSNLLKYAPDATEYTYTVAEPVVPNGYTMAQDGNTITNTYDGVTNNENPATPQEPVTFTATKQWAGLPNGAKGAMVFLQLKRNDVDHGDAVPVADDGAHAAEHTWSDLPKYAPDATEYTYTVAEPVVPNGYTMAQDGNAITNTYDGITNNENPADPGNLQESVTIHIAKTWQDADGQAITDNSKLPAGLSLTLHGGALVADEPLTLTGADEWKASLKDRAKYDSAGEEIIYSLTEAVPNGYTFSQVHSAEDDEHAFALTNRYDGITNNESPADPANPQELVTFTAIKEWKGLPAGAKGATVSLQLKRNDVDHGDAVEVTDDGTHAAEHTWSNLPKYAPDATEYTYTVAEPVVPNGYTMAQDGNTITNTYDGVTNNENPAAPGNPQEPVTIHIAKAWQDADGQPITDNGKLPASLSLTLHGGALVADEPLTLTGADEWKASLANRAKYDSAGEEITYSLTEAVPNGYTFSQVHSAEDDVHTFALTNRYDGVTNNESPADPAIPQEPVTFTATKQWAGLPNGAKGATVFLQLKRNDVDHGDAVLVADNGTHAAEHTWINLPKYAPDATEYTYTVAEPVVPNGYTMAQDGNTITNTYDGVTNNEDPAAPQEPVTFTATKQWAGLPNGAKGAMVFLQLKRNDVDHGDAVPVADDGTHAAEHTWSDLPKYAPDATEYTYTVAEPVVPNGYTMVQDGNTITNTYDGITNNENPADPDNPQEPVTISALKVWTDVPSNVRLPNGVTLTLIRSDGVSMGERRIDAPAGQAPWTCEWSGLKKYAPNSTSYAYTVEEPEVPLGFYVMYEGNGADGYTVTNRYAPAMYDSGADINVADLFE